MSRSPPRDRLMFGSKRKTVSPKRARSASRERTIVAVRLRRRHCTWRRKACRNRSKRAALPQSSRDSINDVQMLESRQASRQACQGVRTLWPGSKPTSKTSRNSRSASGATRAAAARRERRIIKSTSLYGAMSRRPYPPWATRAMSASNPLGPPSPRSASAASTNSSTTASRRLAESAHNSTPEQPA